MKTRWPVFILLAVLVAALFLPAVGIYVHSRLGGEAAALFPEHLSLWDLAAHGNNCLPTDEYPALALPDFGRLSMIGGLLLTAAALLCTAFLRKGSKLPLLLTGAALVLYGTFLAQWGNLSGSLLFVILLKLQAWIYVPLVILVVLAVFNGIDFIRHGEISLDDRKLRMIGGALAAAVLLAMLLPVYSVQVPDTLTDNPADAASVRRNASLYSVTFGTEENLYTIGQRDGTFTNVLSGDLKALEPFSSDANNIQGIFVIRGNNSVLNAPMLIAAVLFLVAAVLSFLPRVDRWFPLAASAHTPPS